MASYPDLNGRSVFISGGATGIGEALVRGFADQGCKVAFVDIAEAEGAALAAATGALFLPVDITDTPAYQVAIRQAADQNGPITVLVNNAANDVRHPLAELTPERYDQLVGVNLKHMIFAAQAVAPMMQGSGGGAIINFGSISWMIPQGNFPSYASSKAAVHGLTRTLARDLGPDRIRVNTLVPGWVMTEKQKRLWLDEAGERAIAENQCLPDKLQPEHIAHMALFLASDAAAMCTAQNFIVDGGWV
jgi:NAD(P)-dependent dehydrogenase (short-subunit alcohol dehydrogenase family)